MPFKIDHDQLDDMILKMLERPKVPRIRSPLGQMRGLGRSPIPTFIPKPIKPPKLTESVTQFPFLRGLK